VNSLPKTVTRQRDDCDLNPGPSAPESSTLTTRLPGHPTPDITQQEFADACVKHFEHKSASVCFVEYNQHSSRCIIYEITSL